MAKRIPTSEEASLACYYREVERYPVLTDSEERALTARIAEGDRRAVDALVKANLRFVIHVARKFQHQGLPLADLINEGNLGLLTAARKFDPGRGCKFITYAVWWIKQNIHKAIENQTRPVRVPANVLNDLCHIRRAENGLAQVLERDPTTGEISRRTDFGVRKVRHALAAGSAALSLNAPRFDDGQASPLDSLADEGVEPPDAGVYRSALQGEVAAALDCLSPRSRTILALHFGMDGHEPCTYQQIGLRLGVSRERVRQLKEEALERLRQTGHARRLASYCN